MTPYAWIGIAGLFLTLVTGFAGVLWRLSKLELKIDLMWDWYCKTHDPLPGGKRWSDPPDRRRRPARPSTPAPETSG